MQDFGPILKEFLQGNHTDTYTFLKMTASVPRVRTPKEIHPVIFERSVKNIFVFDNTGLSIDMICLPACRHTGKAFAAMQRFRQHSRICLVQNSWSVNQYTWRRSL